MLPKKVGSAATHKTSSAMKMGRSMSTGGKPKPKDLGVNPPPLIGPLNNGPHYYTNDTPFLITSRMPADEMEKAGPAEARVSDDDVVDEPSVAEAERCVRS